MKAAGVATSATRSREAVIALVFVVVAIAAWLGIRTGVTIDNDTHALEDAFATILKGGYAPSRTSGFPAYELTGAAVWAFAGRTGVMLLSTLATLGALALLIRPSRARSSWLGLVCWTALALCPLVLTNASALMETSFALFGLALLIWCLDHKTFTWTLTLLLGLTAAGLILSRPDAILVVLATLMAVLAATWPRAMKLPAMSAMAIGIVLAIAALTLLTARLPFSQSFLQDEALIRRVARGGIGLTTAFSVIGAFAILALTIALLVGLWHQVRGDTKEHASGLLLDDPRFITIWLLLTFVLYGIRFVLLADELEYLLPLAVVLSVATPHLRQVGRAATWLGVLSLAGLLSTSVLTISLLDRSDPWVDAPTLAVAVNSGGFIQDLQVRDATSVRSTDSYKEFQASSMQPFQADLASGSAVLLPRDEWHFIVNEGYSQYFDRASHVIGCREFTSGTLVPNWRSSQRAGDFSDLDAFDQGALMHCSVVANLRDGIVTPSEAPAAH